MNYQIQVYTDGEDCPVGYEQIIAAWNETWNHHYAQIGTLEFLEPKNLKHQINVVELPENAAKIVDIRNPDLLFVLCGTQQCIGGVEITTHSPDGSNAEKRYPYLWASNKLQVNGFIACPYQKIRARGGIDKLPNRHSRRNISFLNQWESPSDSLCQIVPVRELQLHDFQQLPENIKQSIMSFSDLGEFFAHYLALTVGGADTVATEQLLQIKQRFADLANACIENTSFSEASTFIVDGNRWIQVYNCRPDSGHWERGEGQFDSIDGRLMFTLDRMEELPQAERPERVEFWLPQMCSNHPWILEQMQHNYGSKRLKNILLTLQPYCLTKFADQLTDTDWEILRNHPKLLLERLDWDEGIFSVSANVPQDRIADVAIAGIRNTSSYPEQEIVELLSDGNLYVSTFKGYSDSYFQRCVSLLKELPEQAVVLFPRIPRRLLEFPEDTVRCRIISAESCNKTQLLMLRQLHRFTKRLR